MSNKFIRTGVSAAVFILLLNPCTALSQLNPLLDSLDEQMHQGKITSEEWYYRSIEAGLIFPFEESGFVESLDSLNHNQDLCRSLKKKSGLILHVPKDFQRIAGNGNRSIQAYIINLTDTSVSIPRKDAVIKPVDQFLLIKGNWKQIKDEGLAGCGNGYWTQELKPNHYLSISISNHDISTGNIKVKQKIRLNINGYVLESSDVTALLNENQLMYLEQGL